MVKESMGQGLGARLESEGKRTLMLVFFGANDGTPPIYSMLCVCVCVCVCVFVCACVFMH